MGKQERDNHSSSIESQTSLRLTWPNLEIGVEGSRRPESLCHSSYPPELEILPETHTIPPEIVHILQESMEKLKALVEEQKSSDKEAIVEEPGIRPMDSVLTGAAMMSGALHVDPETPRSSESSSTNPIDTAPMSTSDASSTRSSEGILFRFKPRTWITGSLAPARITHRAKEMLKKQGHEATA